MIVKNIIGETMGEKLYGKLKKVCCTLSDLYHTVSGFRKTYSKELMVYQVNQLPPVSDGSNRLNKDGVLALGDDGRCLRNVKVDPEGYVLVKHDEPIEVVPHLTEVHGVVSISNTLNMKPVTIANPVTEVKIQEDLRVVPEAPEVEVLPFHFDSGLEVVLIPGPCRVYSLYLKTSEPCEFEIPGVVDWITADFFRLDLYPGSVKLDKLVVSRLAHCKCGGYVTCMPCDGTVSKVDNGEEDVDLAELFREKKNK